MPMREAFKECSHLQMTALLTEVPYNPKTFLRYNIEPRNYFCTKNQKIGGGKMLEQNTGCA